MWGKLSQSFSEAGRKLSLPAAVKGKDKDTPNNKKENTPNKN